MDSNLPYQVLEGDLLQAAAETRHDTPALLWTSMCMTCVFMPLRYNEYAPFKAEVVIIPMAVSVNHGSGFSVMTGCLIHFFMPKYTFPRHKINPAFNRNCKLVLVSVE